MSIFAILLLTLSAIAHAAWNLFGKRAANAGISFYIIAVWASAILYLPIIFLKVKWMSSLPFSYWRVVVFAGIAETIYMVGLSGAYKYGSLGLSYPIARALPVLIVPMGSFLIFNQLLSLPAVLGMVLVTVSMLSLLKFDADSLHKGRAIVFAVIAALGTVAYSLIDYQALQMLRNELPSEEKWTLSIFYAACQGLSTLVVLSMVLLSSKQRSKLKTTFVQQGHVAILAGVVMAGTYALVLFSYMFVSNVGYAVAFRQLSIPIGVILGVVFLKEKMTTRAWLANIVLLSGLLIVVTHSL